MPFAGYNEVVRIPSGATNIDVRQHSYSGKPEDDNYLGKRQYQTLLELIVFVLHILLFLYGVQKRLALIFFIACHFYIRTAKSFRRSVLMKTWFVCGSLSITLCVLMSVVSF